MQEHSEFEHDRLVGYQVTASDFFFAPVDVLYEVVTWLGLYSRILSRKDAAMQKKTLVNRS